MINSEIIKNEKKQKEIERLEDVVKIKDDELTAKKAQDNLTNGNSEVKELKDELNRARDMFLEYEHKIKKLKYRKG